MSKRDRSITNTSYQLLRNRLGISGNTPIPEYKEDPTNQLSNRLGISENSDVPEVSLPNSTIPGVNDAADYLKKIGGYRQQDRMITDKRKSLNKAVKYSYQGAFITKIQEEENEDTLKEVGETPAVGPVRALINPNQVKQDYDDKVVSVGYEYQFASGDVFKWENTGTYWLIYLQDLTELAYFRGDIRKCRYKINWLDNNAIKHSTYAAIKGPIETKINTSQKDGISVDIPNLSLNILMPKNKATLNAFKRYSKFFLNDLESADAPIAWRVEAVDSFSMPGILAINAVEYYYNRDKDDVENGLINGLITMDPLVLALSEDDSVIVGEKSIKPKKEYVYKFAGGLISDWKVKEDLPLEISEIDEHTVKIKWTSTMSGQFDLHYGTFSKTIIVESLF